MFLSSHFTLKELTDSQYAIRHGLDNTPDAEQIENLKYLCQEILEPVRMWFNTPVIISSGYRSKEVNTLIGGSGTSIHCIGAAADIDEVRTIPLMSVIKFIYHNCNFTELIAEYLPGGWVHAGIIKGRENEKVLKIKDRNHNYVICKNLDVLKELLNG